MLAWCRIQNSIVAYFQEEFEALRDWPEQAPQEGEHAPDVEVVQAQGDISPLTNRLEAALTTLDSLLEDLNGGQLDETPEKDSV